MSPDTSSPDVRKRARAILATRLAWLAAGLVLAAVLVLQVVLTVQEGDIQEDILAQAEVNGATAAAIRSCTIPGGDCYQRSREQTASAVATINEITYLASYCADRPGAQTVEEIQRCVISRLAQQQP